MCATWFDDSLMLHGALYSKGFVARALLRVWLRGESSDELVGEQFLDHDKSTTFSAIPHLT